MPVGTVQGSQHFIPYWQKAFAPCSRCSINRVTSDGSVLRQLCEGWPLLQAMQEQGSCPGVLQAFISVSKTSYCTTIATKKDRCLLLSWAGGDVFAFHGKVLVV